MKHAISFVLIAALLLGCSKNSPEAAAPAPTTHRAFTDMWLGQWNGPEGTFLKIEGGEGVYRLTIQNLDGPRTFQGTAAGKGIQFERDGVKETIIATDGAGTGMKWLADKNNRLVIRPGEGFCRDREQGAVQIREVAGTRYSEAHWTGKQRRVG